MKSLTLKQISVHPLPAKHELFESMQVPTLRPPLKWAGGKRWQLPNLRPLWQAQSHRRLVEPFAGGLAVSLGLRPKSALLNDINPHVINFYRWLKRGLQIDMQMLNSRAAYT